MVANSTKIIEETAMIWLMKSGYRQSALYDASGAQKC